MHRQFVFYLLSVFLIIGDTSAGQNGQTMTPEQIVCGLKEPLIFWLWSSQAGRPDQKRLRGLRNVEDISFTTQDGRILRGYKLAAKGNAGNNLAVNAKGYLLVLQGNAILADQILGEFRPYADAGYDVYIYDYRGYGRSEGKRRLKAMVSDYQEIIASLGSEAYRERLVYAMSFGGILLLDALEAGQRLDRVVIDSSPARLSGYGCPEDYDPVNHLPADCSNYLFITGLKDKVVSPAMSREMVEKAREKGATIVADPDFSHPFMDPDWSIHQRRMKLIADFLLKK
jgi:alpha/beta superfamily hydrolase